MTVEQDMQGFVDWLCVPGWEITPPGDDRHWHAVGPGPCDHVSVHEEMWVTRDTVVGEVERQLGLRRAVTNPPAHAGGLR